MWLLVAILVLTQAPANSEDAIKQKKVINPKTFMNVVSQENSLGMFIWGREGWRGCMWRRLGSPCVLVFWSGAV